MFKPYADRVASTEAFLESVYEFSVANSSEIKKAKTASEKWQKEATTFPIDWELDSSKVEKLHFHGFESALINSHLGPYKRLKYYRDSTKNSVLNYYPHYSTIVDAQVPKYYLIPFAQQEIIERLEAHAIEMIPLKKDTLIECDFWEIEDFQFGNQPYEGHFRVENIKAKRKSATRKFYQGDLLVPGQQAQAYFLASVLHPMARDSYISWGLMHSIFGQKEYFSAYVFEDTAEELLVNDTQLKADFAAWQKANPEQAKNAYASLNWIYQHSDYFEEEYLRYPIGFIN